MISPSSSKQESLTFSWETQSSEEALQKLAIDPSLLTDCKPEAVNTTRCPAKLTEGANASLDWRCFKRSKPLDDTVNNEPETQNNQFVSSA